MIPELGIIEGYFGEPWTHAERKNAVAELKRLGYSFFHYAPKADAFLRRRWREPPTPARSSAPWATCRLSRCAA